MVSCCRTLIHDLIIMLSIQPYSPAAGTGLSSHELNGWVVIEM